jgi:glutathione S-transferase
MPWVSAVIMLACLEFLVFGFLVGRARGKYGVKAPAVSGHEMFERYFRVHYNTLEQLVVFVPAVWFSGQYVSETLAAVVGAVFVLGRLVYAASYISDPKRRSLGFALSLLPIVALVVGSLYGIGRQLLQSVAG